MKNSGYIMVIITAALSACLHDPIDPPDEIEYHPKAVLIEVPEGFPQMPVHAENALTEEGIALGRELYYDPVIHIRGEQSCASCHVQEHSFSSGSNVMPHINLGFDQVFLWNGSIEGSLEDAMYFEVDHFFETNVALLNNHPTYPIAFKKAFGINTIESKHVAWALAQFIKTQCSFNSRYDQYKRGETKLTRLEQQGEYIFFSERGDCFHCHGYPLMKDNQLHNNGLNDHFDTENCGHYSVSNDPMDLGKFKTPTLRNIALTAPYMHDGRFNTLTEVIAFYSYGVKESEYTDPLMKKAHNRGIGLNMDEVEALVAFLETLTDTSFIHDPGFHP